MKLDDKGNVRKIHNVSLLMYHFVCPAKYRKKIFTDEVEKYLVEICKNEIEENYEIRFDEIWVDGNHVHFLIQSVPMYSPKQIIQKVKSITAVRVREKYWWKIKKLWLYGNKFWSRGYYVNTVWKYWNYDVIKNYVSNQWKRYKKIYEHPYKMESLFSWMVF